MAKRRSTAKSGPASLNASSAIPSPQPPFSSLGVKDLLEAREAYHVHLAAMPNVVATAIGRYFFHEDDWFAKHAPDVPRRTAHVNRPKTLLNTVVRPWSWPCVLVFVRDWKPGHQLGADAIPKRLFLPDGRVIPTCVILAPPDQSLPEPVIPRGNTNPILGGGYSCIRKSQGVDRLGTFGCLVAKEGVYYALTNKHVAGTSGDPVEAIIRGQRKRVGVTHGEALAKRTLGSLFPGYPSRHSIVNVDAGLVRIDDVSDWTAQVYGIGEIDEMFEATETSITLDLIGMPLRAFGGTSGVLEGSINALFFRYKTAGDFDYLADVLVGPRAHDISSSRGRSISAQSHPGDSGTLWFYDPSNRSAGSSAYGPAGRGQHARRLKPVAMQWGGERVLTPDGKKSAFALATFFSTVCRELDAEVVRTWGIGFSEYWGKTAHFAVGWKACDLVGGRLGALMQANQPRIGFPDEKLNAGSAFSVGRGGFVPLADVPDYVWVSAAKYVAARAHEGQQHFADIDIVPPGRDETILDACLADAKKVSATYWRDAFKAFSELGVGPDEGSLPFRVWQIFDEMVRVLRLAKPDFGRFVAAAGVLAHYVADASMPFHCSWLHHGFLPMKEVDGREYPVAHDSKEYTEYKESPEAKVHAIYDQGIMEIETQVALSSVNQLLENSPPPPGRIKTGYQAAVATTAMMGAMRANLSAEDIIKKDDPSLGPKERARRLWGDKKVRAAAVASLAASTELVAELWTSAWKIAGGDGRLAPGAKAFDEDALEKIYRAANFLPAFTLDEMAGEFEPS